MAPQDTDPSTPLDDAAERVARAADRGRIADIEAQILELERTISSLYKEKNSLRDRLATYTYPLLTLPSEIVSTIFLHFLPNFPAHPPPIGLLSPYLLCQICRQWRHIAFATPPLWSVISLSLGKVRRLPHKLRYLTASLKRSGSCLISFKLESQIVDNSKVAQIIIDYGARWEYLELSSQSLHFPANVELRLPFVRGLKLGGFVQGLTAISLVAPSLRQIALKSYHDHNSSFLPWSQLTVISVNQIQLDQYSHLIHQLVNIIYCHLSICHRGKLSLRNATLSHLETLILDDWVLPDHTMSRILGCLTLPALRRLQVRETFFTGDDPVNPLVSLVARSGCNLRELSVLDTNMPHQKYCDAFPVASIMLNEQLAITEPFLNFTGWKDGEETESADSEASDSDEE
ncbi:hypothetical protein DFH08DRAFT_1077458 [Mycena albidolilacea]|uniref:F-box domain-containing protein n=1 Tax=Mycena albidolilacea TaxID=1033008 RepID=A0AAD7EW42_9AGAR|nr:hypothetical protein DFH08DRAFT_1077458 [Mycena albidolilacea]